MADNPHEGHRKRLKNELLQLDFPEEAPDHKILEMLLFYGIPRRDTNPIAHALLDKFGSLAGVFEADPQYLFEVEGMTQNSVCLIKIILPIVRKSYLQKYEEGYKFSNIDEYGEQLVKRFFGHNKEMFIISCFDNKGALISTKTVAKGDTDNVSVSVKTIVKIVLHCNPTTVIVAHNHVDSPAVPSKADIEMTQNLKFILQQINIRLLDHIIVSGNDYVSMRQSGDFTHLFDYTL